MDASALPHSPYRALPFQLPTKLVAGEGAADVRLDDASEHTCASVVNPLGSCVVLRSNHMLAPAVPLSYFEVKVVEEGVMPSLQTLLRGYRGD